VTFLFTDIEGSTRRWETDADAMRAALLVHNEVLHTAIQSHGGFLFSHTGDGVVAAFASPASAVDAAAAAQRALELPVRMGIATGTDFTPKSVTRITAVKGHRREPLRLRAIDLAVPLLTEAAIAGQPVDLRVANTAAQR
jgi:class 3 adenylate cyclase